MMTYAVDESHASNPNTENPHMQLVTQWLMSTMDPPTQLLLFAAKPGGKPEQSLYAVLGNAEFLVELIGSSLKRDKFCADTPFPLIPQAVLGWTPRALMIQLAQWNSAPTALPYACGKFKELARPKLYELNHPLWLLIFIEWELLVPGPEVFSAAARVLDVQRPLGGITQSFGGQEEDMFTLIILLWARIAFMSGAKQGVSYLYTLWFDVFNDADRLDLMKTSLYAFLFEKAVTRRHAKRAMVMIWTLATDTNPEIPTRPVCGYSDWMFEALRMLGRKPSTAPKKQKPGAGVVDQPEDWDKLLRLWNSKTLPFWKVPQK
jgi:hypothetical protein